MPLAVDAEGYAGAAIGMTRLADKIDLRALKAERRVENRSHDLVLHCDYSRRQP